MTSSVVIGAGFGDEGKGLITDFEVRRTKAGVVARFNGGAQAGHTVQVDHSDQYFPNKRHVFGHVSSGSFAGADTYLSSKFIINPTVLTKELQALNDVQSVGSTLKLDPWVFTSEDARVTTIFDVMINQIVESSRSNRHGSCGLGINETVTRHEEFPLTVKSLRSETNTKIEKQFHIIKDTWLPKRLAALGITEIPADYQAILNNIDMPKYVDALLRQLSCLIIPARGLFTNERIVFEGAQGLMLDEFMGDFPHVTRSMTGLPYAIQAAAELGQKSVKPIYVTRAYSTRHGAGYFPFGGIDFGGSVVDKTNVTNDWQGTMQIAPLNTNELVRFIAQDWNRSQSIAQLFDIKLETPTLAITCLDQLGEEVKVINWNENPSTSLVTVKSKDFPQYLIKCFASEPRLKMKISHLSYGPTAADVIYQKD